MAHVELERSFSSWTEPDQVFLLRSPRNWMLVTLTTDGRSTPVGRGAVSAEALDSLDALADAISERYSEASRVQLLDAGRGDPDLYRAWAPTRIERDFDQASLYDPGLTLRGAGRRVAGWHVSAVERMAEHLEAEGFEVGRLRMAAEVDDETSANPVLGVVDVSRYGVETPGIVRVDDAGEVYVRPPFDDPLAQWDLVDVGGEVPPVGLTSIEW